MGRLKNNTQNLNRGEKNAKPNKEKVLITPKPFLRKRIIVQPPIENKMILMSMACLQNIITDFRTPCPECKRTELKVEATVHKGIRQFVALSCPCGHRHGDYSMPEGANYAFAHSLMSNGLSKTKVNNFFLQMNLLLNLKSGFFGSIFRAVDNNLIKMKDVSINKWVAIALLLSVSVQNKHNYFIW